MEEIGGQGKKRPQRFLRGPVATDDHISGTLFFDDFFMVSNENLDLICYREPIGTSFFAQKGHFLIFQKNYTHFQSVTMKNGKSLEIILFANRMS